jgi:Ca-activated chloride channel homolog
MKFCIPGVLAAFLLLVPILSSQAIPLEVSNALISHDVSSMTARLPMVVRKEVREVDLILSVTDGKGHFVQGLTPSDLTILDNDDKQTEITFFQSQTNLPLHIAFVFDISSSVSDRLDAEQYTISSFLKQVTKPRDSVLLYAFNDGIKLSTSISGNWKQVAHRVRKLHPGGETALYDAVTTAALGLWQDRRPARKILILISDGEENASKTSLDTALTSVLKAETVVYAVNVGEDRGTELGKQGETTLQQLADATGGAYLHADRGGDVGAAFAKIQKELRSQYALAYKPSNLAERLFHHLTIVAGNLRVRCRRGYYVLASN